MSENLHTMARTPESATTSRDGRQTSRLLLLPGEIRNIIYAFCRDPRKTIFYRIEEHAQKRPGAFTQPKVGMGRGRSCDVREHTAFAGLVLACRQLYAEFHPIYIRNTPYFVDIWYAKRFLRAVEPGNEGKYYTRVYQPLQEGGFHARLHRVR